MIRFISLRAAVLQLPSLPLLLLLLLLPGTYNDQIRDNNRTQCLPCPGGSTGTVEGASSKDSCNRKWAPAQRTAVHPCSHYGPSVSARRELAISGRCFYCCAMLDGLLVYPCDSPPNMLCT